MQLQFETLDPATIEHVGNKFLIELEAQLEEKKATLETVSADDRLAPRGACLATDRRPHASWLTLT